MGTAHQYLCGNCGHRFTASEDFDYGFLGEVITPVVCAEHGISEAEVGVNLACGDEMTPEILAKQSFPRRTCGKESPVGIEGRVPNALNRICNSMGKSLGTESIAAPIGKKVNR